MCMASHAYVGRYKLVSPTSCGNGIYLAYFSGTRGKDCLEKLKEIK